MPTTRRDCLKHLLALGASCVAGGPRWRARPTPRSRPKASAGASAISATAIGGQPDTVQMMLNRGHVYVGHMFTDGVTVLDVSNPRAPRPVGKFFTAGRTRAPTTCRSPTT